MVLLILVVLDARIVCLAPRDASLYILKDSGEFRAQGRQFRHAKPSAKGSCCKSHKVAILAAAGQGASLGFGQVKKADHVAPHQADVAAQICDHRGSVTRPLGRCPNFTGTLR